MAVRNYSELIVWQKAMDLVVLVYEASLTFPREEMYGLTSQIRRAAVSIPSNIAEGSANNRRLYSISLQRQRFAAGSGNPNHDRGPAAIYNRPERTGSAYALLRSRQTVVRSH